MPTAFSPNGDGVNDAFTVYSRKPGTIIRLFEIYNRWGNLLFRGEGLPVVDPTVGWQGTAADGPNGRLLGNGVFTYVVSLSLPDGESHQLQGSVHLVL